MAIGSIKQKSSDKRRILGAGDTSEPTTDWRSIYIAAILSFVGSVQFSLYFSALWPYLQILDVHATENFFGYIVAIYSVGQIISSPLFGYWSNRIMQVRLPLYVGLTLMIIGNACYLCLEMVSMPRRYFMFIGRFITGAGSGNVTLLRTYASTASTFKDRPKAIAYVTCGQALGATCGPLLQLIFTPLSYPGYKPTSGISINMYTAPAYFACLMNLGGMLALHFLFKENYAGIAEGNAKAKTGETPEAIPMYDIIAFCICCFTRFTQMFINTNLETIGSPFAMMMFNWAEDKAVTITAAAQGAVGVFTFVTYVAYIFFKLENYISSRKACMFSLAALIIFHLVTYSWPFLPGHVTMHNSTLTTMTNGTGLTEDNVGCNIEKFDWCDELSPINVYLYYFMYVLVIGFAFPTLNITTTTLFSKVLGPRPQGTQQGIFQISGSTARMVGPVAISALYTAFGPRMAWNMEIIVISTTFISWCCCYSRMVPLRVPTIADTESETSPTHRAKIVPTQSRPSSESG